MSPTTRAFPWARRLAPLVLVGCGARSQPASAPAAPPTAAPASLAPAAPAGAASFHLEGGQLDCTLTAPGGQVTAACAEGTLACAELAQADLAEAPGTETVWRCGGPEPAALVVTQGTALLWVLDLENTVGEGEKTCDLPPAVAVTVVDVVPGGRAALLLRQTGCAAPAQLVDADSLWQLTGDGARRLAAAQVDCEWIGDTADPDAEPPPADAAYNCTGGYLAVEGGAVFRLAPEIEGYVGDTRDADGRLKLAAEVARVPLRWDAAAGRFVAP